MMEQRRDGAMEFLRLLYQARELLPAVARCCTPGALAELRRGLAALGGCC